MGLFGWIRRGSTRRRFLNQEIRDAAERLAASPLSEAAPAVAGAIADLHEVVTGSAHAAVAAAHESLAPVCKDALRQARQDFQKQFQLQSENVAQLASRCRDAVELACENQVEQTEQIRALREMQSSAQEQTRRFAEGYDWQLIKEFCFRFIRILDTLDERMATVRATGTAEHIADADNCYHEIQFALEASGVEQFRPEERSRFAGNEKRLRAVGTVTATGADDHGLVASIRKPGYRLIRDDQLERILRPAHVEVFATKRAEQQDQLQEISS
jgi:molecular chaperone GrpE (heat shock protein)